MTPEETRTLISDLYEQERVYILGWTKERFLATYPYTWPELIEFMNNWIDAIFDEKLYAEMEEEDKKEADYMRGVFGKKKPSVEDYMIAQGCMTGAIKPIRH